MVFLSTLSLRRATGNKCCKGSNDSNFYPRSPCGERHPELCGIARHIYFYPRSPCGERPGIPSHAANILEFLSTLSLRRATDDLQVPAGVSKISIHALLAESDLKAPCTIIDPEIISIHALLAESDIWTAHQWTSPDDFYPRSPCGERLDNGIALIPHQQISIHALLAESDPFLAFPTR